MAETAEAVTKDLSCGSRTEDETRADSGDDYLVKVIAQVMTRDDSSGGWVPTSGGGMSLVGLRALSSPNVDVQYLIDGRRVSDHTVILSCVLKKDFLYTKATPTFHHWRTQGARYGLTFHSSADAQLFEKCLDRAAVQLRERVGEMVDETEEDDEVSLTRIPRPLKETVSLPGSRARTPSPASSMRVTVRPVHAMPSTMYHPSSYPHLNMVCNRKPIPGHAANLPDPFGRFIRISRSGEATRSSEEDGMSQAEASVPADSSYVQFSKTDLAVAAKDARYEQSGLPHDYSYPMLESVERVHMPNYFGVRSSSQKSLNVSTTIQLPKKSPKAKNDRRSHQGQRLRCIYCRELYVVSDNRRGSCPDRPSGCLKTIEVLTCVRCARGALYHLTADEDGDYGPVCVCDESDPRNRRKWVVLSVLSVVLPCLLCYPVAMACHRCSLRHGRCGARHKAE